MINEKWVTIHATTKSGRSVRQAYKLLVLKLAVFMRLRSGWCHVFRNGCGGSLMVGDFTRNAGFPSRLNFVGIYWGCGGTFSKFR